MKRLLIVGFAVAGVLLFLLASASANTSLFAGHYPLLLGLNAAFAAVMLGVLLWQLLSLRKRLRAQVFGARLTLRFLVIFSLLAVLPGTLVYVVSVQFLTKSIESWFDVRVDSALEGGMRLGQAAMDQMLVDLQTKARAMSADLADRSAHSQATTLYRLREQTGVEEAVIVTMSGRVITSAGDRLARLVPELPSAAQMRHARVNRVATAIDSHAGRPMSLRAIVPIESLSISEEQQFLQLRQTVPEALSSSAESVEAVYRDYRELALSRQGLRQIYLTTLTLALVMALFSAIGLAFIWSDRLSKPLSDLAQATQAVARGDFSKRTPVTSRDELGVLIESFNSMTAQLDDARQIVEVNRAQLETAKARLENILANLSAGVLVFDRRLKLTIHNHGAAAILGAALETLQGIDLDAWPILNAFAEPVAQAYRAHGEANWQLELSLPGTGKTLLARGAALPGAAGYVLVFDDVSQLIQAQRATAWAEVARRLAHEIKNPLTPIQLSAERLQMKLASKLDASDADVLARGTRTIVDQVSALKSMVDDFRDYARLPAPVLVLIDLNALILDILALYETSPVPVYQSLGQDLPNILADASQLRQVLHNLIQNAQDAMTGQASSVDAAIRITTQRSGTRIQLSVSDHGSGFPEQLMARIFEPYVTTKSRGTGLGLAIVKKIVDEHQGEISIQSAPGQGATVNIFFPLPEQFVTRSA